MWGGPYGVYDTIYNQPSIRTQHKEDIMSRNIIRIVIISLISAILSGCPGIDEPECIPGEPCQAPDEWVQGHDH